MNGVLSNKTIIAVSSGNHHTCAISNDFKVFCWGRNE
jgi:alpha-tubulin suppressor-like RCC1 family protein